MLAFPLRRAETSERRARRVLAQFKKREPPERRETIESILGWTEIEPDGGTFDPAERDDWEQAVASVIGSDTDGASASRIAGRSGALSRVQS
jgi:hypothetical protein